MNRSAITKLVSFLALAAVASPSLSASSATDFLAKQADAVVVAEIQSGHQTGQNLAFTLLIARLVKGELSPGTTVNVTGVSGVSSSGRPLPQGFRGQYGLWFLKKTGTDWTFLPLTQHGASLESSGYIPLLKTTSPGAVNTPSPAVTTSDQMAIEIVAALQSYTDKQPLYNLALYLSQIDESPLLPGLYRALRANQDPQLKFIGLEGLLGGPDKVSALVEIATNADLIPGLRTTSLLLTSVSGVRGADPATVTPLGILAASTNPDVQRSAAMALGGIHSRATLPFLARLLDAPDSRTRESAMFGLSRFVNNLPIQTAANTLDLSVLRPQGPAPYRTPETDKYSLSTRQLGSGNEAEYLQFWKSWWAANSEKLTVQAQ